MSLKTRNKIKIAELREDVQYAVLEWMRACFEQGYKFKISEAFRSEERQLELYAQGRTTQGNIVTWTRRSKHTKRLAIDLYAANGINTPQFFDTVAMIGKRFGITHPLAGAPYFDYGHFELDNVPPKPIEPNENTPKMLQNRRLLRLMARLASKPAEIVKRAKIRIAKRYPWFPIS